MFSFLEGTFWSIDYFGMQWFEGKKIWNSPRHFFRDASWSSHLGHQKAKVPNGTSGSSAMPHASKQRWGALWVMTISIDHLAASSAPWVSGSFTNPLDFGWFLGFGGDVINPKLPQEKPQISSLPPSPNNGTPLWQLSHTIFHIFRNSPLIEHEKTRVSLLVNSL